MAIYDAGTASLSADGTVTGVGTTWRQPLTLIRVGATMIFNTSPISIVTIAEILSDTSIRAFNDKGFTATAGTQYFILAHDGITVQGLAQDVAETLRYYQSSETQIADLVELAKSGDFDFDKLQRLVNEAKASETNAALSASDASASQKAAATSQAQASSSASSALEAYNNTVDIIANAGDAGTLVTLAGYGIATKQSPSIQSFDWQNVDLISGAAYNIQYILMSNVPTGVKFGTPNPFLFLNVVNARYVSGSVAAKVQVSTRSDNDLNTRVYDVYVSGVNGSRKFDVRENLSIVSDSSSVDGGATSQRIRNRLDVYSKAEVDATRVIAKGGTGATTAAGARTNLDVYAKGETYSRSEISSSYGLSVIDFGAKGDGVTDDTAAFQSAIDSAPIGGLVIVPTPSVFYSIGSEIRISKPITIQGNGGSAVYRGQYPSIKTSGFNGVFRLVPTESSYRFGYGVTGVAIKGLSIEGRSITDRNPFAIAVDESINGGDYHVRECDFSDLHIKYFDTGLNIKGIVYLNTFFGVRALWCGNGCHIDKASGAEIGNSDQNRFFGCEFVLNTNGLILSNESHQGSQTITGCTISENTGIGLIIGYNCTLSITGSQIEANGTGIRVEIPASVTNPSSEAAKDVSGNWFLGNGVDIHVIKSTTSLTSGFSFPMDIRSNSFNRTVNEVLKIDAPTGAKEFDSRQFKLSSSNSFSSDGANPGIIPLSKVTSGWLGYNGFKEDGKVTISAVVNSTSQTNVGLIRVPAFKQCYVNFELVSMPANADTGGRDRATAAITFANSTNPGSPTAIFEESSTTGGEFMIDRVESETFVSININANAASRNAILSCSYCIM